ncbi:hypothetical protein Lferr_0736 [Acidithiobacillus ferrooxidans ATCC 53993]|nr:hypothetical protein Lferr_0736 [Acidithiobacillus ferrooxidans ATCC 53993]
MHHFHHRRTLSHHQNERHKTPAVISGDFDGALGVMLTPWSPSPPVLLGAGLTLLAGGYTYLLVRRGVTLRPYHFLFNGLCYGAYFFALT